MNIKMIGASGFVGTRLISLLKEDDEPHEITNVDLLPSPFYPELTQIGDVKNLNELTPKLKGADWVILLAAQHRDDVSPVSLYYDTNVGGMRNTLKAMEANGVKRLVFFSSVAVYGLNKENPREDHPKDPFNHYGRSKWQAEQVLQEWYRSHPDWVISIVRPTVIFGERNRGNVYNLLRQIASGKFLMVGKGNNKKSMAYVGNVVAFVRFLLKERAEGYQVFNYIDKPDLSMNELLEQVSQVMNKKIPTFHLPYSLGMLGGYTFDAWAKLSGKKLTISSVRVKKFCATTQFDSSKMLQSGYIPPYSLQEGLARTLAFEFIHPLTDDITFLSE